MTGRQSVPLLDVFSRGESLPFLGDAVDQTRAAQVPHRRKSVHQHIDVVTIDWTEITEAQLLEQHTGSEEGFDTLFPLAHQRRHSGQWTRR